MKNTVILATLSLLFNTAFAMNFNINVQKHSDSISLKINNIVQNIKPKESVNIGTLGTGIWDGNRFSISSYKFSTDNLSISSRNVPVSLNSLQISKCDVYAPGLLILGDTNITTFTAKIKDQKSHLMNIQENLTTKTFTITGPIRINGSLLLQNNGSFIFKNPGFNTLVNNGYLSSEEILRIQKENCSKTTITNNGTISSREGIISCCADEFTNESMGIMKGEEARFYIGPDGLFQNHGTFEFKKLLFRSQTHE